MIGNLMVLPIGNAENVEDKDERIIYSRVENMYISVQNVMSLLKGKTNGR